MFKDLPINGKIEDLVERNIASVKKSYQSGDEIEYIDISSIDNTSNTVVETTKYEVASAPSRAQQCVKNGDILVSTVRPINRKIAVVTSNLPDLVASTGFCILRHKDGYREYLLSVVKSDAYTERMCDKASGGLYPAVNNSDVLSYGIHIPNKELAQKVSSIYQQADKSKFTRLKSQFIEMFDQVKNNKYGYKSYKLSECCSYISDGSHYSPKEDPNGQYPMLSVKDMTEKGFTYRDCKYINKEEYDKLVANGCKPEENDVLVAKDGSYFKYSFTILEEQEQAVLSSIAILRPNISIMDSKYLAYYLLTPEVIHMVEQNYLTGTAIKRVILKGFKELPVLLPPLDKQQEFVSILHQADKSKLVLLLKNINYD